MTRPDIIKSCRRWLQLTVLLLLLPGCFADPDPDEEGGIIGTGVVLSGNIITDRLLASIVLEIKGNSGLTAALELGADRGFHGAVDLDSSAYLMRADLGNDTYLYGAGFSGSRTSSQSVAINVHRYSDVALRSLFNASGIDIDDAFESEGGLPDSFNQVLFVPFFQQFIHVLEPAQEAYGLAGFNWLTGDASALRDDITDFVALNPVVVTEGKVSLFLTEPESGAQTNVAVKLPLQALGAVDAVAPASPLNLRVLQLEPMDANAENAAGLRLAWLSAEDDGFVAEYEIRRNGAVIATTPFTYYLDTVVEPSSYYSYNVVAIDVAGNRSEPSSAADIRTDDPAPDNGGTEEPDTTDQTITLDQLLVVGRDAVYISWFFPPEIEIDRFELNRSIVDAPQNGDSQGDNDQQGQDHSQTGEFIGSTAGYEYVDANVEAGTEYCYSIEAVGPNGQHSSVSTPACIVTPGERLENIQSNTPSPVFNPATDFSRTQCLETLPAQRLTNSLVLTEACYFVDASISIAAGSTLNLSAGTVLKFSAGTGMVIEAGGSLLARGSQAKPVVFTAVEDVPGFWNGITFEAGAESGDLSFVVIEFAGGQAELGSAAAVQISCSDGNSSPVQLSKAAIRQSAGHGVHFLDSDCGPNTTSAVVFSSNAGNDIDPPRDQ